MSTGRLGQTDPLNTPALVAQGFRETVEELQTGGKLSAPSAVAFLNAAVAMIDALRDSPEAAKHPDAAVQLMNRAVVYAVASAGFADGMLSTVADKSKLN